MSQDINKIAQRAAINGGYLPKTNPVNSKDAMDRINRQYFTENSRAYFEKYGDIASNVYDTECQGIDTEDFYKYVPVKIRVANVVQANTGEMMPDDHKRMIVISPAHIDYVSQGAMLSFGGNTWLVYKGKNIGATYGAPIIRRCNAVINKLDYYGNIVSVPMSFSKMGTQGNAPVITENNILSQNYFSAFCQINEISKHFIENTRVILGKAAYRMRGLDDYNREFTNDPDSIHLLAFTLQREGPLEQDNMELQVADYYSFSWKIAITAEKTMNVGGEQTINVESIRNGDSVASTEEYPITYIFESSDESVLTVDESGEIRAIADGTATITATLAQNENISQSFEVEVSATGENYVGFINSEIKYLREFDEYILTAAYFENGVATDNEVVFRFDGVPDTAYSAVPTDNANQYKITCYKATKKPLVVTISANGETASASIALIS